MEYRFESPGLSPQEIRRRTMDMWADLAFDDLARHRLRRDGVVVDRVRLTGPCPYQIVAIEPGQVAISVAAPESEEQLIDLWRVHFMRGLRMPAETE